MALTKEHTAICKTCRHARAAHDTHLWMGSRCRMKHCKCEKFTQ